VEVATLVVLGCTFVAIVWYSWETHGMRKEMEASRRSADRRLELLQAEHERHYDVHVTVAGWDPSRAALTLVNAGPGPAVEVSIRARVREISNGAPVDRFLAGSGSAIPVGGTREVLLSQEIGVPADFPPSGGERLTVEFVATTALGKPMPVKTVVPTIGD